jgi:hypothetical protein
VSSVKRQKKSTLRFDSANGNRWEISNYGRIIRANQSPETDIVCVLSDGHIIQSTATIVGHDENERSIFVPRIPNHHHYPLIFRRGLC